MEPGKQGNFIEAFSDRVGFDIPEDSGENPRQCACGEKFFSGSWMTFMGVQYIIECECWLSKGKRVVDFIDEHAEKIAHYLNSEKKRKIAEAARMPEVDTK